MSARDDGGPAFPFRSPYYDSKGLSLRDWFAGQALQATGDWNTEHIKLLAIRNPDLSISELIAQHAYDLADAMLQARKK